MAYIKRVTLLERLELVRGKRCAISYLTFDRSSDPLIPGLNIQLNADVKEAMYRVLKESDTSNGIDLYLYTRGGDVNSVWPIVSLIREFDKDFEVLVPFRCHSGGTLIALGATKIIMGPISELSPIDPSTGNQFNPLDPITKGRLAISVEDVQSYKKFIHDQFRDADGSFSEPFEKLADTYWPKFVEALTSKVHPLALGNVQRVLLQIKQLAHNLLDFNHGLSEEKKDKIVEALTARFYSHLHMINRHEAKSILGQKVQYAPKRLVNAMDSLLREYEDNFRLRNKLYINSLFDNETERDVRFIGAVVESASRSYLFETCGKIKRRSEIPQNVQIQVPQGQAVPIVPGLPITIEVEIFKQQWMHNKDPIGVTV